MSKEQAKRVRKIGNEFCDSFFHNVIPDLNTPTGRETFIFKTLFYRLAEALSGDEPDRSIKVGEVLGIVWLDHSHFEITSKNAYVKPEPAPEKIEVGDLISIEIIGEVSEVDNLDGEEWGMFYVKNDSGSESSVTLNFPLKKMKLIRKGVSR